MSTVIINQIKRDQEFLKLKSTAYTAKDSVSPLATDMKNARGRIILASAWATQYAIKNWREHLRAAVERRVRVCSIVQEPDFWYRRGDPSLTPGQTSEINKLTVAINDLERIGIHVMLKPLVHQKLIVIDEDILWEGSLNVLSWSTTFENPRRWKDRFVVDEIIKLHELLPCAHCPVGQPLCDLLRARRIQLGMTQAEFAIRCGTPRRLISALECGRRNLQLKTFENVVDSAEFENMLVPKYLVQAVRGMIAGPPNV